MSITMGIYLAMVVTILYAVTIAVLAVQSARRERRRAYAKHRAHRLRGKS